MKKKIKISANYENDLGIIVSVDGRVLSKHTEVDLHKVMMRLLVAFGHNEDEFEIEDCR